MPIQLTIGKAAALVAGLEVEGDPATLQQGLFEQASLRPKRQAAQVAPPVNLGAEYFVAAPSATPFWAAAGSEPARTNSSGAPDLSSDSLIQINARELLERLYAGRIFRFVEAKDLIWSADAAQLPDDAKKTVALLAQSLSPDSGTSVVVYGLGASGVANAKLVAEAGGGNFLPAPNAISTSSENGVSLWRFDDVTEEVISKRRAQESMLAAEIARDLFRDSKAVNAAMGKGWRDTLEVKGVPLADTTWTAGPAGDEQIVSWLKAQALLHSDKLLAVVFVTGDKQSTKDVKALAEEAKNFKEKTVSASPGDFVTDPAAGSDARRVILFSAEFTPKPSGSETMSSSSAPAVTGAMADSTARAIAIETVRNIFGDTLQYSPGSTFQISYDSAQVPVAVAQDLVSRIDNYVDGATVVPIISLRHPDYKNPGSEALQVAWQEVASGLNAVNPAKIIPAQQFVALPPDNDKPRVEANCFVVIGTSKQSATLEENQSNSPVSSAASTPPPEQSGPAMAGWGGPFVSPGYFVLSDELKLGIIGFGGAGPIWGRVGLNAGIGASVEFGPSGSGLSDLSGFYAEVGPNLRLLWRIHAEAGLSLAGLSGVIAYGNYYGLQFYPGDPGLGAFVRITSHRVDGEELNSKKIPTHSEHGVQVGLRWNFGRPE